MACFTVPTVAAVLLFVFRKKVPKNVHINWLITMIFGGALALAVEHIAHKEIIPVFPFLSAMANPHDFMIMLEEMALVGIPMTFALIFVWIVLVVVYEKMILPNKQPIVLGA